MENILDNVETAKRNRFDELDTVFGDLKPERFIVVDNGHSWGIKDQQRDKVLGKSFDRHTNAWRACEWFNEFYKAGWIKLNYD